MDLDQKISISVRDAIGVLRVLTEVCVSIDRIGASSDVKSEEVANLDEYVDGGQVFRALSEARAIMTVVVDAQLPDEVEAVDTLVDVDGAYWPEKPSWPVRPTSFQAGPASQQTPRPRVLDVAGAVGIVALRANAAGDLGDEHVRWAVYRWAFDHDETWEDLLEATRVDPDTTLAAGVVLEMLTRVPTSAAGSWIAACPGEARALAAGRARDVEILRRCQRESGARGSAPASEWSDWLQRRVASTSPDPRVLALLAEEGRTRKVRVAARERLDHQVTTTRFDGTGEPITPRAPTYGFHRVRMPDGATVQLDDMDLEEIALADATGGSLRLVFRWDQECVPATHRDTPFLVVTATRVVIERWDVDADALSEYDDIRAFDWDGARTLTLDTDRRRLRFHADTVTLTMAPEAPTEQPDGTRPA